MEFTIPYNGDLKLLKKLKNNKYDIETVYGKMGEDIIGGGRAKYEITNYGKNNLREAIKLTHSLGAEFNYLLNAPCTANMELERKEKIINLVKNLAYNFNVDKFTVATPFLLDLIKSNFKNIKVSISIIAKVDSLEKVNHYEKAGADEITLDYNIHRNFKELKRIRENSSINFKLLANDGYLFNCPWADYHFQLEGHDSQQNYNNILKYFSYCRFKCKSKVAKDNFELIKGMWIRPEDIHFYEEIGYENFKIIDRLKDTRWLLNVVEAYQNKEYNGNLSDILCSFDTYEKEVNKTPLISKKDININNIQNLGRYWDLKPYINNYGSPPKPLVKS